MAELDASCAPRTFCKDYLPSWKNEAEPYNYNATGILGVKRPTMASNVLLRRTRCGKPNSRPIPGLPKDFTYGDGYRDPYNVGHAMHGWVGTGAEFEKGVQKRELLRKDGRVMPDVLNRNRAAVSFGMVTSEEFREFRAKHKDRLISIPPYQKAPPLSVDPYKIHGVTTTPSQMFSVLTSKAQDDWIAKRKAEIEKYYEERNYHEKRDYRQVRETKSSQLRIHMNDTGLVKPLWQMPKFTRKAEPSLSTFRSKKALQAAKNKVAPECYGRLGMHGQGITARGLRQPVYPPTPGLGV